MLVMVGDAIFLGSDTEITSLYLKIVTDRSRLQMQYKKEIINKAFLGK